MRNSIRREGSMHLIVDGYEVDRGKMKDLEQVYELLDRSPSQIGMTKIAPPYVFRYVGSKPQDWGISGFVLIAESHISIHTFPEHSYVNIDIFSCKDFDVDQALRDLRDWLGTDKLRSDVIKRGLDHLSSEDMEEVADIERLQVFVPAVGRAG